MFDKHGHDITLQQDEIRLKLSRGRYIGDTVDDCRRLINAIGRGGFAFAEYDAMLRIACEKNYCFVTNPDEELAHLAFLDSL